jgi:ketosteroid isomerase-like protein
MNEQEKEIIAVLQERNDAMIEKDIDTLDRLTDDAIIIRHITGAEQTKQEWFKEILDEKLRYYKIVMENPVIKIQGDTATAKYTSVIEARIYGSHGTWRINSESHFVKRENVWIRVTSPQPRSS